MNQELLDEMKKQLLVNKEKLEKELKLVANDSPDGRFKGDSDAKKPEYGNSDDENADEVVAFQENISTAASLEEHMDKIIGALNRVEKGTYGKCIICDKDLPEDRLRALPSAENCTDCK